MFPSSLSPFNLETGTPGARITLGFFPYKSFHPEQGLLTLEFFYSKGSQKSNQI